jgi:thioredoxin-related protein
MNKILTLMISIWFMCGIQAQTGSSKTVTEVKLYLPEEKASQGIREAVTKAVAEKKYVLVQAGGNWCGWCIEFNRFCKMDPQIDSVLNADFVIYHLNYSKENLNKDVFAKYGYPQRFGFPVFIILDEKGNRLHTQNSGYLEDGKSYNKEKVMDFLLSWNPKALAPSSYINQ